MANPLDIYHQLLIPHPQYGALLSNGDALKLFNVPSAYHFNKFRENGELKEGEHFVAFNNPSDNTRRIAWTLAGLLTLANLNVGDRAHQVLDMLQRYNPSPTAIVAAQPQQMQPYPQQNAYGSLQPTQIQSGYGLQAPVAADPYLEFREPGGYLTPPQPSHLERLAQDQSHPVGMFTQAVQMGVAQALAQYSGSDRDMDAHQFNAALATHSTASKELINTGAEIAFKGFAIGANLRPTENTSFYVAEQQSAPRDNTVLYLLGSVGLGLLMLGLAYIMTTLLLKSTNAAPQHSQATAVVREA